MKTALLVIDVQKLYTDVENDYLVENASEILDRINQVIDYSAKNGYKIVYIRHIHAENGEDAGRMFDYAGESEDVEFVENTLEVEYSSGLKIVENAYEVIKHRYDSFIGTNLDEILKDNEVERVIIVGFMTNFCCESTARSAHDRDYFVDFIFDATGTPGVEDVEIEDTIKSTCANLLAGFANVISTNDLIG